MSEITKDVVRFAKEGDPSLLILSLDPSETGEGVVESFALPLNSRDGGLLIAVPFDALSAEALAAGNSADDEAFFGPSTQIMVPMVAEDEVGNLYRVGEDVQVTVIDVSDALFGGGLIREYDPVTDSTLDIKPFSLNFPEAIPEAGDCLLKAMEWATSTDLSRANFYSAREEPLPEPKGHSAKTGKPKRTAVPKRVTTATLAGRLESLEAQISALVAGVRVPPARPAGRAKELGITFAFPPIAKAATGLPSLSQTLMMNGGGGDGPGLAKAAQMLGPPPRTKTPGVGDVPDQVPIDEPKDLSGMSQDPMLQALLAQGTALTALVAQMSSGGDPMMDLQLPSSSSQSTTTRGVQRRERMQSDLALGTSQFWLQFQQQIHRRLNPSRQVPKSDLEVQESQTSFLTYLERFGGYKSSRDLGLINWMLGQAVDAASQNNFAKTKEHLALAVCAIDQAAQDQDWTTAFLISLSEDPPAAMFQEKTISYAGTKPFSPLIPGSWAAVTLAFLKELEVLSTKKAEVVPKSKKTFPVAPPEGATDSPSPKRKPRFPKRPKAAQAASNTE